MVKPGEGIYNMMELTICYKNGRTLVEKVDNAYIKEGRLYRCVYDRFNTTHWESLSMEFISDVIIVEL